MSSKEPPAPRYFEDCKVGQTFEFGSHTVTKEGIIEFAEQYDPQSFHTNEDAAIESLFGGLIASGWHTAAICVRMLVDGLLKDMASAGGRGVEELRWHKPVRPGDVLSLRVEIVEKRHSEDDSGLGHVHAKLSAFNQNDEKVISWVLLGMIKQRKSG